jgi:hypothetical protein
MSGHEVVHDRAAIGQAMLQNELVEKVDDLTLISHDDRAKALLARLPQSTVKPGAVGEVYKLALEVSASLNEVWVGRHVHPHRHELHS